MDFPGGRVPFTSELKFVGGHFSADTPPMSCYRTVDSVGDALEEVQALTLRLKLLLCRGSARAARCERYFFLSCVICVITSCIQIYYD